MDSPLLYLAVAFYLSVINLVFFGKATESPHYTVLLSESDFEIRLYKEILWISAPIQGTSFRKSTKDGFHRIYQYIHGANLNSSRLPMTAPVLTSVKPTTNGTEYVVKLFLTINYESSPPQPNPELNLQLDPWKAQCMAVRKFSGFADDDNTNKEMKALVTSFNEHLGPDIAVLEDSNSYTIAQYNASYHTSGRLNEVWMDISGFNAEGCLPH